jgi:three-Cys-motif partner protein
MTDIITASDGLPALLVKQHTLEKLNVIQRYIDQFATAMKPTGRTVGFRGFGERNYIDLFSGPGVCVVQGSNQEMQGSPLLALSTKYPLSNYYFVDINLDYISALKRRADMLDDSASLHKRYFAGDSNQEVHKILRFIDKKLSVNLALIDGFGVECTWPTVELLASCQRMDLIILFPQGMSINRNLKQWAESESNALDAFFGTDEWRQIYRNAGGQANKCIRAFLDLYQRNLRKLGYAQTDQVRELLVRSRGGQKLYYLIFASRHPLGERFWKQATETSVAGQKRLFDC